MSLFPPELQGHENRLFTVHKKKIKRIIEEKLKTRAEFTSFTRAVVDLVNSHSTREPIHSELAYLGSKVCVMIAEYKTLSKIVSNHPGALIWKTVGEWRLGNTANITNLEKITTNDKLIILENLAWRIEASTLSDIKTGYSLYNKAEEVLGSKIGSKSDPILSRAFLLCMAAFGKILRLEREYEQAIQLLDKGLDLARRLKDRYCEATILHSLALVTEDSDKVIKLLDHAIRLRSNLGDKQGLSNSINNKAIVFHERGALAKALQLYSQSLSIEEEIGNKSGIGSSLNNIGIIYHTWGDYKQAEEYYSRTVRIERALGNFEVEATALMNLAELNEEQGNYETALKYLNASQENWEKIGLGGNIDITLSFCNVLTQMNELEKARNYIQEAEQILRKKGTEVDEVWTQFYRAKLEKQAGNLDDAQKRLILLIRKAEKTELFEAVLHSYLNLSEIFVKKFEITLNDEFLIQACNFIKQTSKRADQANIASIYVQALIIEGILLAAAFEFTSAIKTLDKALEIANNNNLENLIIRGKKILDRTKKQKNAFTKVYQIVEKNIEDIQLREMQNLNLNDATKYLREADALVNRLVD
ncbi:MAG: tetratricopeptide repeat protein [Candidatus Hermodarchaeota archaeon]